MKCATDLSKVDLFGSLEGISTQTIEEFEQLYISHVRVTRFTFSIEKYTQSTRKDIIVERYYVCSCEGKTHHVDPSIQALEHPNKLKKMKLIPTTRYDCKTRIRVKLDNENGLHYIKQHIILHTHELIRAEWQHLYHSKRHVSVAEKIDTIKSFEEASIRHYCL